MSEWITLDSAALNAPREESIGGMVVMIQLSPHDVPIAVRGRVLDDSNPEKYLVEFRYLDDEPWKLEARGTGIHVRVGKYSRRLYGIEISRPTSGSDSRVEIRLQIPDVAEKAIDDAVSRELSTDRGRGRMTIDNFLAAKAAIASVRGDLFQPA